MFKFVLNLVFIMFKKHIWNAQENFLENSCIVFILEKEWTSEVKMLWDVSSLEKAVYNITVFHLFKYLKIRFVAALTT